MASKPIRTFRYHNVRVAVWENQTKAGIMYNVSVCRPYVNRNKEWAESNSFSDIDLPALAKAVSDAHTWIQNHKSAAQVVTNSSGPDEQEDDTLADAA